MGGGELLLLAQLAEGESVMARVHPV